MGARVAFHTLGCKLNFAETNSIGESFIKESYSIVDFESEADIYVINTCSVTQNAERECRQIVRRALRTNPSAYIIVTGCYAQLRPDEIASIYGVDAVLGSREKYQIFEILDHFNKQQLSCIYVTPTEDLTSFNSAFSDEANSRTRAFFKIQDGCDYTCTYCTIPLARGKSRSFEPDDLVEQFQKLISAGYKEIVLTGVNVGDYGKYIGTNLYEILQRLIAVPGDFRIRISSIEPNLLTDEIIQLTKNSPKLTNHFHIPLQSGSDKILGLMQRRYNSEFYRKLISKITLEIPDVGIGVDVIVGTPGETDEDFQITYDFLKDLPISYLHVFTYSERPDTKAIELDGKVPKAVRKERNAKLRILSEKKSELFRNKMLNKTETVLFELEEDSGYMKGFTSNYIRVKHPYFSDLVNKFSFVKLTDRHKNLCSVEIISNPNSLAG